MPIAPNVNQIEITPAITIGIGKIGEMAVGEILRRRELYLAFQGLDLGLFDDLLTHFVVGADYSKSDSLEQIRGKFMEEMTLRDIGQNIQSQFRGVSAHIHQPLVNLIQPQIFIIGALWEPSGAALVWPLADLTRRVLGWDLNYQLIGIFISANYNSSSDLQVQGDARAFTCLMEGESLFSAPPSWQRTMQSVFGGSTHAEHLYDQVFLLDSLKSNNATMMTKDNEAECMTHTSALVEGLMYTESARYIDQTLLDDFLRANTQSYIGVGTSSIRVPLREIYEVVQKYTVGILLKDHLLRDLSANQADAVCSQAQELGTVAVSKFAREVEHKLRKCFVDLEHFGAWPGANWGPITYHVEAQDKDILSEGVAGVKVRAPNPFSSELSLHINSVLERLRAETASRYSVIDRIEDSVSEAILDPILSVFDEMAVTYLHQGDIGLRQASDLLAHAASNISAVAASFRERSGWIDENQIPQWTNIVEGGNRWYYDVKRLRPIVKSKPRFWAILVRLAILVALAFQFYWSSITNGKQPWPFHNLGGLALIERWGANWDWYLFGLMWVPALLLLGLFVGVPEFALRTALRFHRKSLQNLVRHELNRSIFAIYSNKLAELVTELTRRVTFLNKIWHDLQEFSSAALSEIDDPVSNGDYLEYIPVTPREIADFEVRERIANLTLERHPLTSIVDSWLPEGAGAIWETKSARSVISDLNTKVEPVVHEILVKPAEDYLRSEDHADWIHRLWLSSVPWLKALNGTLPDSEEPIGLTSLSLHAAADSEFAQVAQQELDHCYVFPWFDPYRILLMRMQCGVPLGSLTRYSQLEQAFEMLHSTPGEAMLQAGSTQPPPSVPVNSLISPSGIAETSTNGPGPLVDSSPDAPEPWKQDLAEIIVEIVETVSSPEVDEADRQGVLMTLEPIEEYLGRASTILSRQEMAAAMWSLDEARSSIEKREVWDRLSPLCSKLDDFLRRQGIIPEVPQIGKAYDHGMHGRVVDQEHNDEIAEGAVLKVLRRGYRDIDTNDFLVVPDVVVSEGNSTEQ